MTEDDRTGYSSTATADRAASLLTPAPKRRRRRGLFRRRNRTRRIRWLRLLAILVPLGFLAVVSTVFGMVLAFAPQLGPLARTLRTSYSNGLNSEILAAPPGHHRIGILTNHNQYFLPDYDVPLLMDNAIVAIEDKRFYTEPGIDYRGIARAFVADVFHTGGGTQGGSTITEQFVKNALSEQGHRTIFEKLREAALAFQLTHLWSKSKILAEYLNTSYFGNGAHGIEAAARAYFGNDPSSNLYGCGTVPNYKDPSSLCVTNLTASEAALLAGMVDAPTTLGNDLYTDPQEVYYRRNLVLKDMYEQNYLTYGEYVADSQESLPPAADVQSPSEEDLNPSTGYFVQWIENQLTGSQDKGQPIYFGSKVYSGGYTIHTTLDYYLQQDAQSVVDHTLPPGIGGPAAALVAIDNKTGAVKAMVGGYDFSKNAFNLATEAERQPGSAFKVFDLAVALKDGDNANTKILSKPFTYTQQADPFGDFSVHNDEGGYEYVPIPLWEALALSDNSVFARLGLYTDGESNIAALAHQFGISTTISLNPSMVIGGLQIGVTPLDMAHAYETIANDGQLTTGSLASDACVGGTEPQFLGPAPPADSCPGPVGVQFVTQNGKVVARNSLQTTQVLPSNLDQEEIGMMRDVMTPIGTGAAAAIPGVKAWGKTGTTSNYADAWFVGSTAAIGSAVPSMTVAVWVGFPNSAKSMSKDYGGKPVYGGTYPALIWRQYVEDAIKQYQREAAGLPAGGTGSTSSSGATGAQPGSGATATTGVTGTTGTTTPSTGGAAANTTAPTGATTPATGTVTGGGGSSAPGTGATTPAGSTTPATGTPPATSTGGGVSAPGGGTSAPPG